MRNSMKKIIIKKKPNFISQSWYLPILIGSFIPYLNILF